MNTIRTIERYNDSLLARYRHGDCDIFSYDDIKILIDDKNISEEIVSMMLECESKEDSEYIFNRIFNKTKEPTMQTIQTLKLQNPTVNHGELSYKGFYYRSFLSYNCLEMFLFNGGLGKLLYTK